MGMLALQNRISSRLKAWEWSDQMAARYSNLALHNSIKMFYKQD